MRSAAQGGKVAFVFDLDGTLVDSARGIGSALAGAFAAIGRRMPESSLLGVIGPPIRVISKRLEPELSEAEAREIEVAYRALYDESAWRQTELFLGVGETLHRLHGEGHRLFVATNKPRIPAMKILAHLRLSMLFEDVVTRDSAEPPYAGKGEMLASLMERHGLRSDLCMMVGDTAEDEEAARAHGVRFAFVSYGYGSSVAPDWWLDGLGDLVAIAVGVQA